MGTLLMTVKERNEIIERADQYREIKGCYAGIDNFRTCYCDCYTCSVINCTLEEDAEKNFQSL